MHTMKRRKTTWIGGILCKNCHVKHIIDGKMELTVDEVQDLSNYWMDIMKWDDIGNWKGKYCIAVYVLRALEGTMDP